MDELLEPSTEIITGYFETLRAMLLEIPKDAVQQLVCTLDQARQRCNKVLICGNGGSGSTAAHWAVDLSKGTVGPFREPLRALTLCESMPYITALANDLSYERVFAEQIQTWVDPNDVLVAISTSGNSPNLICAAEHARTKCATVVGILGRDGGQLVHMVDFSVLIKGASTEQIEDVQLMLGHVVTLCLRQIALRGS